MIQQVLKKMKTTKSWSKGQKEARATFNCKKILVWMLHFTLHVLVWYQELPKPKPLFEHLPSWFQPISETLGKIHMSHTSPTPLQPSQVSNTNYPILSKARSHRPLPSTRPLPLLLSFQCNAAGSYWNTLSCWLSILQPEPVDRTDGTLWPTWRPRSPSFCCDRMRFKKKQHIWVRKMEWFSYISHRSWRLNYMSKVGSIMDRQRRPTSEDQILID